MVTKFERLFFRPTVYKTFTFNDDEGERQEYVIKDIPIERFEEATQFMIKYFFYEETFFRSIKVPEAAMADYYRYVFKQKTSIGCFNQATDEMVGINALTVRTKGFDTSFKSEDPILLKLRRCFAFINGQYDVFDHYNVIYYLYAHGLTVKTENRGHGIANELLKARIPFMETHNLNLTASLFTTKHSQETATNIGFQENFSISYEKLQELFTDFDFSGVDTQDCKMLSLTNTLRT